MKVDASRKKPTAYLAGKVNGSKWELVKGNETRANFVASDGAQHSEHKWGYGFYEFGNSLLRGAVEETCLRQIKDCDLLIAYFDDPTSYGSIAEIAYASAIGKDCLLIILTDPTDETYPTPMEDAYWFVSCLPKVRTQNVHSFEQAQRAFDLILRLAADKQVADVLNRICESPIEDAFHRAIVSAGGDHGVGWDDAPYVIQEYNGIRYKLKPQYEVHLDKTYRLDFFIEAPGQKIAVELDGHDYHERTKEQARRDKARDRALLAAGYIVLRFTGSEIHRDVERAVREVLSFLKPGGA